MPSSGDKSKCPGPAIYQNFSTLHIVLSYECVFLFLCTYLVSKKLAVSVLSVERSVRSALGERSGDEDPVFY